MSDDKLPTYMVWSHPSHMQKLHRSDEAPPPVYDFWANLVHPAGFPFRVQEILLEELYKRYRRFTEYQGSLFPVDVALLPLGFDNAKTYYSVQNDSVFRNLGMWLTSQVAAAVSRGFPRVANGVDICVRCIYVGAEKQKYVDDEQPEGWVNPCGGVIQHLTQKILHDVFDIDAENESPFLLCFPERISFINTKVRFRNLVGPGQPSNDWFEVNLQPAKLEYIQPKNLSPALYPLSGEKQARITSVVFPSDNDVLLYIQHCGEQETWVYGGPGGDSVIILDGWSTVTMLDGWSMVPRDGWMPLYSGNIIVLGRIIQTSDGARIVPGSMVLSVEY